MMTHQSSWSRSLLTAAGTVLLGLGTAHAQNASLNVYMRAAGSGTFNRTGSISTQVNVYAVSGLAAKYNGSTNLYAPAAASTPGTAFTLTVPNLYSPAVAPGNTYQLQLSWTDNASKQLVLGPFTLAPGVNSLGAGGLSTTTPIDITNDPPPAASGLSCYPDLPDRSSQLYVYWSGVLLANAKDLNRTELHMSRTAGFTPSAATLIATPPYGTDQRKLSGLLPATDYYFCVRVIDNYGASTDTCRALACTTAMAMPGLDLGAASDGGATVDGGAGSEDAGAGGEDAGVAVDSGSGGGNEPEQLGSVAVGCGCSVITREQAPGFLSLLPALLLYMWRRQRGRTQAA